MVEKIFKLQSRYLTVELLVVLCGFMPVHGVIASVKDFNKAFPKAPKDAPRRDALARYFIIHGVVKAQDSDKDWPILTYPNEAVLHSKIKEIREKHKMFEHKLKEWKKSHWNASMYHQFNQVKKLAEPIYWKHLAKSATDKDYREDAKSVKLPAHLVADKKWQSMVKMFVNDVEYRKQLAETVNTSIAYKKNKRVAKFADDLQEFRKTAASKQVNDLEKKIVELDATESALKEMLKWAKEKK